MYTIWSRGRLVGHTELDYARWMQKRRSGDFHPTEFGNSVMPTVTGPRVAAIELTKVILASTLDDRVESTTHRHRTEEADLASASDHHDGLALELRGPDGDVIPTTSIDIRDTEFTLALAEELAEHDLFDEPFSPELEDDFDDELALFDEDRPSWEHPPFDEPEPWSPDDERPFARYQIHVELVDDSDVP